MSTKNIARSIIEGGRTRGYKDTRDEQKRSERHNFKQFLNQVKIDSEIYDDGKDPVHEEPLDTYQFDEKFADKISPLKRWVEKKNGKGWNNTFSEIKEKFNTDTTPGRHIVEDHLLNEFQFDWHDHKFGYRKDDLIINENGIIKKAKSDKIIRLNYYYKIDYEKTERWLGYKKIKLINEQPFWFVDSDKVGAKAKFNFYNNKFYYFTEDQLSEIKKNRYYSFPISILSNDYNKQIFLVRPYFVKSRSLNKEEMKFWNNLSNGTREKIIADNKVYGFPDYY